MLDVGEFLAEVNRP